MFACEGKRTKFNRTKLINCWICLFNFPSLGILERGWVLWYQLVYLIIQFQVIWNPKLWREIQEDAAGSDLYQVRENTNSFFKLVTLNYQPTVLLSFLSYKFCIICLQHAGCCCCRRWRKSAASRRHAAPQSQHEPRGSGPGERSLH